MSTGNSANSCIVIGMNELKNTSNVELSKDVEQEFQKASVLEIFRRFSPSHQREWNKWIEEAKRPGTRLSRIEKTIKQLKAKS
jgi:uncharacterized protein YdeI (YjbR/CyaY-like superfamily)